MRKTIMSVLGGIVMTFALTFGVTAQQVEIEGTISSQIEAFKVDDFEQAFTYATPTLQRLFQNPRNFEQMVTRGYPMVWRPAEVRYLELQEHGGVMWQKVQIRDQKGVSHILVYQMHQTPDGWRIGGVQLLEAAGANV